MRKDIDNWKKFLNEQSKNNLIVESTLSRIWKHIESDGDFGVISPFRKEYSLEENMKRYRELKEKVRKKGYGYIELKAGFNEEGTLVEERSLFVPNIKKEDLMKWGEEYEQHSVIYKGNGEFVEIGTSKKYGFGDIKNDFIQKGWNKNLTIDSEFTKELFSSLLKGSHRGRKFLFNLKESYLYEMEGLSFNEVAYGKKKPGIDNRLIKLI